MLLAGRMAEIEGSSSKSVPVEKKVVLVCLGEQRKPVSFISDGTVEERKVLRDAIAVAYSDSPCSVAEKPILQMKNELWDGVFVDIGKEEVIPNRAVLRIVPEVSMQFWLLNTCV